jgi:hypothetical protein
MSLTRVGPDVGLRSASGGGEGCPDTSVFYHIAHDFGSLFVGRFVQHSLDTLTGVVEAQRARADICLRRSVNGSLDPLVDPSALRLFETKGDIQLGQAGSTEWAPS